MKLRNILLSEKEPCWKKYLLNDSLDEAKLIYDNRNQTSGRLEQGVQGNNWGGTQGNLNMMEIFYMLTGVEVP